MRQKDFARGQTSLWSQYRFGIFANKKISLGQIAKLNHNLIISHAVGTGQMLAEEIVRAAIFIRVVLQRGFPASGLKS